MTHTCHAEGCNVPVPPNLFMCRKHWFTVPLKLRSDVWRNYRRGQEVDKQPSDAYMAAARAAIESVAQKEGRR